MLLIRLLNPRRRRNSPGVASADENRKISVGFAAGERLQNLVASEERGPLTCYRATRARLGSSGRASQFPVMEPDSKELVRA